MLEMDDEDLICSNVTVAVRVRPSNDKEQENEYVVRPGRGFNTGGPVDMNQYGLGQFSTPFSSLDGGKSASTPDKAIKNALKGGDGSDEYLVALAKADKAKSKTAKDYYMQEAQKVLDKDLFSSNIGMFG